MKTLEQLGISPAQWNHYSDFKIKSSDGILIDDDWDSEGGYAVCISKSDARLMAAAPDLYEALAAMLSCAEKEAPFTAGSGMSIAMDMARKAIKKVGGDE